MLFAAGAVFFQFKPLRAFFLVLLCGVVPAKALRTDQSDFIRHSFTSLQSLMIPSSGKHCQFSSHTARIRLLPFRIPQNIPYPAYGQAGPLADFLQCIFHGPHAENPCRLRSPVFADRLVQCIQLIPGLDLPGYIDPGIFDGLMHRTVTVRQDIIQTYKCGARIRLLSGPLASQCPDSVDQDRLIFRKKKRTFPL